MKTLPIIYNDQYGFIVDKEAEIKDGELCIDGSFQIYPFADLSFIGLGYDRDTIHKLLAYVKLSPESPDIEGLQEVELIDVVKIAKEKYPNSIGGAMFMPSRYDLDQSNKQEGFIEGYNYNRPPFPQPTWDDVEKAIEIGNDVKLLHKIQHPFERKQQVKRLIEELKQSKLPKEFILGEGESIKEQIRNGNFKY